MDILASWLPLDRDLLTPCGQSRKRSDGIDRAVRAWIHTAQKGDRIPPPPKKKKKKIIIITLKQKSLS